MLGEIFVLLVIIVMVVGAVRAGILHNADKLMFSLPWRTWLTLDEVGKMGHSRFWARIILPAFYRKGQLEIRIVGGLSERQKAFAERWGFRPGTVEFYEFRFTERWRRKSEKQHAPPIPELQPMSA